LLLPIFPDDHRDPDDLPADLRLDPHAVIHPLQVFILFFFGSLGTSYLFRISLIRKYFEVNRRNIILWTAVSGAPNRVF
jgi:hypothetical protein